VKQATPKRPPTPPAVAECDDPKWKPPKGMTRAKCRKAAEALHCATHPRDPWCKWKREQRVRDRRILLVGAAVYLALVYFDANSRS